MQKGLTSMKIFTAVTTLVLGLASLGMAAEVKGFVEDANCASKPAMAGNAQCAEKCIKGGSAAVLVTPEGKVYKVANQDKITGFAGKNVTVNGSITADTITVDDVK